MYLPNPSTQAGCDIRLIFFKWSKAGLSSEFLYKTSYLIKANKSSLPYLPINDGRIYRLLTFTKTLNKIQTVLFKIWNQVIDFISYNYNCYTKCSSKPYTVYIYIYIYIYIYYSTPLHKGDKTQGYFLSGV